MSNTSARPILPSLQSLAFPSSDRSRTSAGSNQDAGVLEFSKLLQKALGSPDAARDLEDTPPERETISIETLSIAQGFTALDRPLANDPLPTDAAIAPHDPRDGDQTGEDANRFGGDGSTEHQRDGAASTTPAGTLPSTATPTPSTSPAPPGTAEPAPPSKPMPGQAAADALPSGVPTPTATPALPASPAVTVGPLPTDASKGSIEQGAAAPVPAADFASLLAVAAKATPATSTSTSSAHASASPTTPNPPTPAPTAAIAAAVGNAEGADQATPVPSVAIPAVAPSGLDLSSVATPDDARAPTAAATTAAVQNPTLAAAIVATATPSAPSPAATKNTSAANRPTANEATVDAASAVEAMLPPSGGARATLAAEASEPTLRGPAHPPAAFTAHLTQDASSVQVTTQPAPSAQGPQPIAAPLPAGAALTDEGLEAPIIVTDGVDASAARAEPTGREAMITANASPISNEQTVARAQRATMHPAVAQVAVSVTKAVQEGVDRITIKLQPPELGRIDVRIDVGVDGRIQAVFAAERPATIEILQRDVRELERALQNAGLSTDSGSLSFGLKQQGGGRNTPFAAGTGGDAPASDVEVTGDILVARNAAARRADGHLDIHV